MQSADGPRLRIHEGLHSQADPVYSAAQQRLHHRRRKRSGGALRGNLGIAGDIEVAPHGGKDLVHLARFEQAGRVSAHVNGIHFALESSPRLERATLRRINIGDQPLNVALHVVCGKNIRGEVAVAALALAERHRDVQTERRGHYRYYPTLIPSFSCLYLKRDTLHLIRITIETSKSMVPDVQ